LIQHIENLRDQLEEKESKIDRLQGSAKKGLNG